MTSPKTSGNMVLTGLVLFAANVLMLCVQLAFFGNNGFFVILSVVGIVASLFVLATAI